MPSSPHVGAAAQVTSHFKLCPLRAARAWNSDSLRGLLSKPAKMLEHLLRFQIRISYSSRGLYKERVTEHKATYKANNLPLHS